MKALFRILLILVTFFGQEVFSVEMKGLFETEVIASSQELEDRNDAIRKAMTIVLERVLAGENILQDPAVKTALAQAPFFTKQFQYSLVENSFQEESSARTMRVLINEDSLMDLLKSSRLGIWGEVRPETLV